MRYFLHVTDTNDTMVLIPPLSHLIVQSSLAGLDWRLRVYSGGPLDSVTQSSCHPRGVLGVIN